MIGARRRWRATRTRRRSARSRTGACASGRGRCTSRSRAARISWTCTASLSQHMKALWKHYVCAHPQPSRTDVSERVPSASLGPPHRVLSAAQRVPCPTPWQTSPTRPHTRRRSRVSKRSALASARQRRLRTSWLLTEPTQQMGVAMRPGAPGCGVQDAGRGGCGAVARPA